MKTKRNIIRIDEDLCNGCCACVEGCHEGALQMIDGKARIVSELYCDGLGACIGECPVGAIVIEEREAEAYSEHAVMGRIAPKGQATILAHLKHLKAHGELLYFNQAIEYIKEHDLRVDLSSIQSAVNKINNSKFACGCPGTMERSFVSCASMAKSPLFVYAHQPISSGLGHWPIQLHLVNPNAGFFHSADVVLAADCTAFAFADFHNRFLRKRCVVIACPKLDEGQEVYLAKLTAMIDQAKINSLTVVIMEVPCCSGLFQLAKAAVEGAGREVSVKKVIIGIQGDIKEES